MIIDEVGFNEISPLESKLFFLEDGTEYDIGTLDSDSLFTKHYSSPLFDKGNTIFISNITFDKWSQSVTVVCLVTGISRLPSK